MRTAVDCLPCFLRQTLQVARHIGCDENQQRQVVARVAQLLPDLDPNSSPPVNAILVYQTIAAETGCKDPYRRQKRTSNEAALEMLPLLRKEVGRAKNPLLAAVRFAIAGNMIDYGALAEIDIEAALERSRTTSLAIDHSDRLLHAVNRLRPGAKILYLADNCGEVVYDSLVVELLAQKGLDIVVAVKKGPIINDALYEDAVAAGLNKWARIIDNGTACPGTPLPQCSTELQELFAAADLVISKGQGNFETLSGVAREIFFLLMVKCGVVARHITQMTKEINSSLTGCGEMIILHSGQKTG